MPWVTLAIVSASALVHLLGADARAWLYQPAAPSLVQLLGCHLVHLSQTHFVWDTFTFAAVGAISERAMRGRYVAFVVLAAFVVPSLACWWTPWVTHYGGLSGLVIGQVAMWICVALGHCLTRGDPRRATWAIAALGLLLAKQLYECAIGDTSLITMRYDGFATVPAAHLLSVFVGCLVGLARRGNAGISGTYRNGLGCERTPLLRAVGF